MMKNLAFWFVFSIVFTVFGNVGCTTDFSARKEIFLAKDAGTALAEFSPPPSGKTLVLKHEIAARHKNRRNAYTGILKWTNAEIVVSATSEIGRIFTLKLSADGAFSASASSLLPAEARENLHYALWDVQLMFFPVPAIQKILPSEFRFSENFENGKRVRRLTRGNATLAQIVFSDAENPSHSETIVFENFVRDYAYAMNLLP